MAATRILPAVLAIALAAACDDDDTTVIIDDPVDDTVAEGHSRGIFLADEVFDELVPDDFLIQIGKTASILAAIHDGEIDQADFAIDIIFADDVFVFADNLILDSIDANLALDAVVRFYDIGYIPSSAADAWTFEADAGIADLRATPPAEFDFRFVELQVIMHAQAQVVLDELLAIVGPGEMGDYIIDTQLMNDLHLAEAEALFATFF